MKALSMRWRIFGGTSLVLALLVLAGTLYVVHQRHVASQPSAGAARVCLHQQSDSAPVFPPGATSPVTLPAGEPAVVATVNGAPICREGLEVEVDATLENNQKTLQQLQHEPPGTLPSSLLALVKETPNQVRHDALTKIIQDDLLVQAGARLHLTASRAAAEAQAQQILHILQNQPASDPARVSVDDYLRANHFTEQSYFSDPRVIQAYQDVLTMVAVKQHIAASLPAGESLQAGISAYEQHLWQTGHVQVYLPASLGW